MKKDTLYEKHLNCIGGTMEVDSIDGSIDMELAAKASTNISIEYAIEVLKNVYVIDNNNNQIIQIKIEELKQLLK